jgi:hypothetical protein
VARCRRCGWSSQFSADALGAAAQHETSQERRTWEIYAFQNANSLFGIFSAASAIHGSSKRGGDGRDVTRRRLKVEAYALF